MQDLSSDVHSHASGTPPSNLELMMEKVTEPTCGQLLMTHYSISMFLLLSTGWG